MFPEMALSPVKPRCPKDCPERSVGCHGRCAAYAAYRAECDKANKARDYKREGDRAVADAMKRIPGKRAI